MGSELAKQEALMEADQFNTPRDFDLVGRSEVPGG
jgi:hypothetical protein